MENGCKSSLLVTFLFLVSYVVFNDKNSETVRTERSNYSAKVIAF